MYVPIALLPVLLFLVALVLLDSFKLVRPRALLVGIGVGAAVALVCEGAHARLLASGSFSMPALTRSVAPITEEIAKALYVLFLLRSGRLGFLVDAAITGFAVGTGFAVAENLLYLHTGPDQSLVLWLVRGVGTAVLHGATTATCAMVSKTLSDRSPGRLVIFLPGLLLAVAVHAAFNHLVLPPVVMTAALLTILPLALLAVFDRSARATHEWVVSGLDIDLELLALVESDEFGGTRFGGYLRRLTERFPGLVAADMFCLLRLELELSIQAKALVLARAAGVEVPIDDDLRRCLDELRYLNRSIGMTGRVAIEPLRVSTSRDRWHRYLLLQERRPILELFRHRTLKH